MSLWIICEYCGERYDTRKSHFDTCEGYKKHERDRMKGYKDNSNLDKIFNKEEKEYKPISKKEQEKLASAISNMHEKLGDDKFNLVVSIVMTSVKEKEKKGEKFEYKDLERVLKKAIEMVNEI